MRGRYCHRTGSSSRPLPPGRAGSRRDAGFTQHQGQRSRRRGGEAAAPERRASAARTLVRSMPEPTMGSPSSSMLPGRARRHPAARPRSSASARKLTPSSAGRGAQLPRASSWEMQSRVAALTAGRVPAINPEPLGGLLWRLFCGATDDRPLRGPAMPVGLTLTPSAPQASGTGLA